MVSLRNFMHPGQSCGLPANERLLQLYLHFGHRATERIEIQPEDGEEHGYHQFGRSYL